MHALNKISDAEIKLLKPDELIEVLRMLLSSEAKKLISPADIVNISVPSIINVPDGGEDGKFELKPSAGTVINSRWIKYDYTTFQSKAQEINPAGLKKEILINIKSKIKEIKPQVLKCLEAGGEYVVFCSHPYTSSAIQKRIQSMRDALTEAKYANANTAKLRILDAEQIAEWVNEYTSVVTLVQHYRHMTKPVSFETYNQWKKRTDKKTFVYQEPPYLAKKAQEIISTITNKTYLRIIGHKGIGKTRLVLEAFNPKRSANMHILTDQVVYIDLATANESNVFGFIHSHKHTEGIIIVDNCSDDFHQKLSPHIDDESKLKVISINDSFRSENPEAIFLDRIEQRETVKLILENRFNTAPSIVIDNFLKVSEGFPEMVRFIESAVTENDINVVFQAIPDTFITNFIFGNRKRGDIDYELIKACSVFTNVVYVDDKLSGIASAEHKIQSDAQTQLIINDIVKNPVNLRDFESFWENFANKRNLLERRGVYYSVIPEPIAVHLAAQWWEEISFNSVKKLFAKINECKLMVPLTDRLRTLDQSERAKELVAKIWGPTGPFSTAEVINTQLGSRLFRSVVEVNPSETLTSIEDFIFDHDIPYLQSNFIHGRRNIVWALEKVVFRNEFFTRAGKLFFKLAIAENENISNNATSQLLQLFHIYLSGTEADLSTRLELINWALSHKDKSYLILGLKALGECLKTRDFRRIIGSEYQGAYQHLSEHKPENSEIREYWNTALKQLLKYATGKNKEAAAMAQDIIGGKIRALFPYRRFIQIQEAIDAIIKYTNGNWDKALTSLIDIKRFHASELDPKDKIILDNWIENLQPKDIPGQIKRFISVPILDYEFDEKTEDHKDIGKENVERFAEKVAKDLDTYIPYFHQIVVGKQIQAYSFGYKLAQLHPDVDFLLEPLFEAISKVEVKEQNFGMIAGILAAADQATKSRLLTKIRTDHKMNFQAVEVTKAANGCIQDVFELFNLVDAGFINIDQFNTFIYNRSLDKFSTDQVQSLLQKIEIYQPNGPETAFRVITQYVHGEPIKWDKFGDFIRSLLLRNNLFASENMRGVMDGFQISQCLKIFLEQPGGDSELAKVISNNIHAASLQEDFNYFDHYLEEICTLLVKTHFKEFWSQVSKAFISNNLDYINLKFLLEEKNGHNGHTSILFLGDDKSHNEILKWCKKNQPNGPRKIAYIMPFKILIEKKGARKVVWHPFAKKFVKQFYNVGNTLEELSANMDSHSSFNYSSIDYYEELIELMEALQKESIEELTRWAKKQIIYFKKCIAQEHLSRDHDKLLR